MKNKNKEFICIELKKNEWDIIRIILATTEIELEAEKNTKKTRKIIKEIRKIIEVQLEVDKKINKKKSH